MSRIVSCTHIPPHDGDEDGDDVFVRREQDPAREHGAAESHGAAPPQSPDAVVVDDALEGLDRAGSVCALRARLDCVDWLGGVRCHDAGEGAVAEVGERVLRDVVRPAELLEDVVRAQAHARGAGLLQRGGDVAPV